MEMSSTSEAITDLKVIQPRSGTAFQLKAGEKLKVVDIEGEQVSDFICYNFADTREYLSSGRTIDYAGTIFFYQGLKVLFKQK